MQSAVGEPARRDAHEGIMTACLFTFNATTVTLML